VWLEKSSQIGTFSEGFADQACLAARLFCDAAR
jgi:hypothetical protein